MRRMYSKSQLIDLIEEHAGESAVQSVNGKTGEVVLNATDIKLTTNLQTVQDNFIRIDSVLDTKQQQLTPSFGIDITEDTSTSYNISVNTDVVALKSELADKADDFSAGPGLQFYDDEIAGKKLLVNFDDVQQKLTAGTGISISGNTISATGSTADTYVHHVEFSNPGGDSLVFSYYSSKSTGNTSLSQLITDIGIKTGVIESGAGTFGNNGVAIGNVTKESDRGIRVNYINSSNVMTTTVIDTSDSYTITDTTQRI